MRTDPPPLPRFKKKKKRKENYVCVRERTEEDSVHPPPPTSAFASVPCIAASSWTDRSTCSSSAAPSSPQCSSFMRMTECRSNPSTTDRIVTALTSWRHTEEKKKKRRRRKREEEDDDRSDGFLAWADHQILRTAHPHSAPPRTRPSQALHSAPLTPTQHRPAHGQVRHCTAHSSLGPDARGGC